MPPTDGGPWAAFIDQVFGVIRRRKLSETSRLAYQAQLSLQVFFIVTSEPNLASAFDTLHES